MAQQKQKTGYGIRITIIKIRDEKEQSKIQYVIKNCLNEVLKPYARKSVLYFIEPFSYDYNGVIDTS